MIFQKEFYFFQLPIIYGIFFIKVFSTTVVGKYFEMTHSLQNRGNDLDRGAGEALGSCSRPGSAFRL